MLTDCAILGRRTQKAEAGFASDALAIPLRISMAVPEGVAAPNISMILRPEVESRLGLEKIAARSFHKTSQAWRSKVVVNRT